MCEDYEGWVNYPTWAVYRWMTTDQPSITYWQDNAQMMLSDANGHKDVAIHRLSSMVHKQHEKLAADAIPGPSVLSDMLTWAVGTVDWDRIAEKWITEAAR